MKFFNDIYIIAGLIGVFLLQSGCNNQDKWKAVPLKIKKQESFNYSEMISGDLDSTAKVELEEVKKIVYQEKKDALKHIEESQPESKPRGTNIIETIRHTFNNIYNYIFI